MHRFLRVMCLALVLVWGSSVNASAQYASVWGTQASPSPFGYDQSVNINFIISYDEQSGWSYPTDVCYWVTRDDGWLAGSECSAIGEGQMSSQGSASDVPNYSATYMITAQVYYYDYEMGQWWSVDASPDWIQVNYDPNFRPCNGDERWVMENEYIWGGLDNYGEPYAAPDIIINCTGFDTSGGAGRFTWQMVNQSPGSGHPPYGRFTVFSQLNGTQTRWGSGSSKYITVESGYRCPHGNASLRPRGARNSRHMVGDAVDMTVDPWSKSIRDQLAVKAQQAGFRWFEPWGTCSGCTVTHLHADRR